ncbi:hypothetical protein CH367_01055 [Leptospira barantonii]|uniref:Uncharacterized protein n=1 Tax=Leptospira barantonii TaxID=2023184 RepID=A0ABX4NPK3_9LEPT|nr:hypothetical protein CH367_01055 [Leptospira barantonii]
MDEEERFDLQEFDSDEEMRLLGKNISDQDFVTLDSKIYLFVYSLPENWVLNDIEILSGIGFENQEIS